MKIRKHAGGLDDSMKTMEEIPNTLEAVRDYAKRRRTYLCYTEEELASFAISPYSGPDLRIDWDATFIVTYISAESGFRRVFGFCNEAPDSGVRVELLNLDGPTRSGRQYPTVVMQDAVDRFNQKNNGEFFGEMRNPSRNDGTEGVSPEMAEPVNRNDGLVLRMSSIAESEKSHRGVNLRVEHGYVVADIKPNGVAAGYAEMLQNCGKLHFAMRAFVSYAPRLPMDKGPMVVSHCDIVTFDLCDKPL